MTISTQLQIWPFLSSLAVNNTEELIFQPTNLRIPVHHKSSSHSAKAPSQGTPQALFTEILACIAWNLPQVLSDQVENFKELFQWQQFVFCN